MGEDDLRAGECFPRLPDVLLILTIVRRVLVRLANQIMIIRTSEKRNFESGPSLE
jgi:hypothetical protein